MGNPYEARKRIVEEVTTAKVVETPEVVKTEVAPVVETVAVTEPVSVPEGKVAEILEWVGGDVERAVQALSAEEAGARRTTLVKALEEIIAAS